MLVKTILTDGMLTKDLIDRTEGVIIIMGQNQSIAPKVGQSDIYDHKNQQYSELVKAGKIRIKQSENTSVFSIQFPGTNINRAEVDYGTFAIGARDRFEFGIKDSEGKDGTTYKNVGDLLKDFGWADGQGAYVQFASLSEKQTAAEKKRDAAITDLQDSQEFPIVGPRNNYLAAQKTLAETNAKTTATPQEVAQAQENLTNSEKAYNEVLTKKRESFKAEESEQKAKFEAALSKLPELEAAVDAQKGLADFAKAFVGDGKGSRLKTYLESFKGFEKDAQKNLERAASTTGFLDGNQSRLDKMSGMLDHNFTLPEGSKQLYDVYGEHIARTAGISGLPKNQQEALINTFVGINKAVNDVKIDGKPLSAEQKEALRRDLTQSAVLGLIDPEGQGASQLQPAPKTPTAAEAAIKKSEDEKAAMRAEQDRIKSENEKLTNQLNEAQAKINSLQGDLDKANGKVRETEGKLTSANDSLNRANQDLETQKLLKEKDIEIATLKGSKVADEKIAEFNKKIAAAEAAKVKAETDAANLEKEAEAAKQAQAKAEKALEEAKKQPPAPAPQPPAANPPADPKPPENPPAGDPQPNN